MKNCQLLKFAASYLYALEVKVSQACEKTEQKYCNLLLHYQKQIFLTYYYVNTLM